jgi:hypothetical protein
MKKIGLLCLALVLALGTLGIGYATWSANVTIQQEVYSGELCAEFDTLCTISDEEGDGSDYTIEWLLCDPAGYTRVEWFDKDEAWCTCNATDKDQDGIRETMVVTCNNTYPSYYNHLDFWLCNCGTIPYKIQGATVWVGGVEEYSWDASDLVPTAPCVSLDLNNDTKDDIELHWGNCFGRQVHPTKCDANCSFDWHILQDAPQNQVLQFEIKVHVVQWNKYDDPTD